MCELVYSPGAQRQAFADACAWAEDIHLCLAWLEPGDAQGPSFADLEPHQSKVRQAIIGLTRLQSYPSLLRRLHRASVLRLVSTMDGSFSPNCYVFQRGTRMRVLVASAPFTSTRFAQPCESLVVFEGERDERFALRAAQLLERCRSAAHVPTRAELDRYEEAWAEARTGGRVPDAIPGLGLHPFNVDSLGDVSLVEDRAAVLDALVEVRDTLIAGAAMRVPSTVVPAGEHIEWTTTLYWSSFGVWSALHRKRDSWAFHCGFVPPWEVERVVAAFSADVHHGAAANILARRADAFVIGHVQDSRRFVIHVSAGTSYSANVDLLAGTQRMRGTVVGEVGAADFVQTAAAFAHGIRRASDRASEEE